MTIEKMLEIMSRGDSKGSALKELALYYDCINYDLSPISDEMADNWLARQKCDCYEEGNWFIPCCGTCLGTKENEPCTCEGDRTKCNFYGKDDSNDS